MVDAALECLSVNTQFILREFLKIHTTLIYRLARIFQFFHSIPLSINRLFIFCDWERRKDSNTSLLPKIITLLKLYIHKNKYK